MEAFPDKLNLLYVSSIGEFLVNVDTRYLVKPFSEEEFFICHEPSIYFGNLSEIFDFLCYDYDKLPVEIKRKYNKEYKSFERLNGNLYHLSTKIYDKKIKKK
jgi:hypothetical protein